MYRNLNTEELTQNKNDLVSKIKELKKEVKIMKKELGDRQRIKKMCGDFGVKFWVDVERNEGNHQEALMLEAKKYSTLITFMSYQTDFDKQTYDDGSPYQRTFESPNQLNHSFQELFVKYNNQQEFDQAMSGTHDIIFRKRV